MIIETREEQEAHDNLAYIKLAAICMSPFLALLALPLLIYFVIYYLKLREKYVKIATFHVFDLSSALLRGIIGIIAVVIVTFLSFQFGYGMIKGLAARSFFGFVNLVLFFGAIYVLFYTCKWTASAFATGLIGITYHEKSNILAFPSDGQLREDSNFLNYIDAYLPHKMEEIHLNDITGYTREDGDKLHLHTTGYSYQINCSNKSRRDFLINKIFTTHGLVEIE